MPTYEYECEKCGKVFEAFQSMTDAVLTKCPEKKCKGKVHRLIGAGAGLIFKGSGFYITDYKKSGASASSKSESKSESKTESKSESKSEAKGEGSKKAPAAKGSCSGGGCGCH